MNKLGLDGELYRNTGDYVTPVWDEIENVKDLTLALESGEADVTTRANNGWRATMQTLKEASIEFQMVWDTEDVDFAALRDAFLNNTTIEFAVMDGDITTTGSEGLRAEMSVIRFSRDENLEEAMMANVTIKPTRSANPPEWMVIP